MCHFEILIFNEYDLINLFKHQEIHTRFTNT